MKNTFFEDEEGTHMQAHYNQKDKCVIVLKQEDDILVYVFEDASEVNQFINHLKRLIKN